MKKIRNYKNLGDFEKIKQSSLKAKQLVYCKPNLKEFMSVLTQAKNEFYYLVKNLYSVPVLTFQQPLDVFENNFDDSDW